jgi:hypothetical protein
MRFPELDARDLDGRPVALPADLGAGPALLLVRFAPDPTPDAETWLPVATDLSASVPGFWAYDLLVLPAFPADVAASLTDELRGVAGDRAPAPAPADGDADAAAVRALTAHTDLAAFRRALVLDRPASTYALVVREGRVRWRAFGPLTTALERSLRAAVAGPAADGAGDLVVP